MRGFDIIGKKQHTLPDMKILALNGSPRQGWNTDMLLEEALRGAASKKAETEHIHLYAYKYHGCLSCFECKRKDNPEIGRCAVKDELSPILDAVHNADGIILGSPIYFDDITSALRALIERLVYQYLTFRTDGATFFSRRMPVGLIYTMNVSESYLEKSGYIKKFKAYDAFFTRFFGPVESIACTETLQTGDYSKYELSMFDEAERRARRENVFPHDCKKAYDLGASLALKAGW